MIRLSQITVAATVLMSGCVNLDLPGVSNNTPVVHYVLEDAGRPVSATAPSRKTLIMVDTLTSSFYDNDGMAFSKEPGTRSNYQFARWTDRPGKRFTDLLINRLDQENLFTSVALTGTNVHGDWLLTTEILEFYHDAVIQPGTVKMVVQAEVIDLKSHALVSRKRFTRNVAAPSYDAAGAYRAFSQAVTLTINDLADWLKALSTPN
jgi:cholesterol transport system auxiliary component